MAKRTFLAGWVGNFVKQVQPAEVDGEIVMTTSWAFVMREQSSGDEIIFAFVDEVKVEFQKQLNGGIEIAGSMP